MFLLFQNDFVLFAQDLGQVLFMLLNLLQSFVIGLGVDLDFGIHLLEVF